MYFLDKFITRNVSMYNINFAFLFGSKNGSIQNISSKYVSIFFVTRPMQNNLMEYIVWNLETPMLSVIDNDEKK